MTTAIFSSHQVSGYQSGSISRERRRVEAWFAPAYGPVLDAGDFCAIAFAFAFAAGLVLGVAVACDAYLMAVISRGAGSLEGLADYQLARDLLPWAGAFTMIAAGLAITGLKLAQSFRAHSQFLGFSAAAA